MYSTHTFTSRETSTFFIIKVKTTNEILELCKEITFYDHHNIDRVMEMKNVCDYLVNLLNGKEFKDKTNGFKVMLDIDDTSLKIIDRDVKNIKHDISNLRIAILQMFCLERIFIDEK